MIFQSFLSVKVSPSSPSARTKWVNHRTILVRGHAPFLYRLTVVMVWRLFIHIGPWPYAGVLAPYRGNV